MPANTTIEESAAATLKRLEEKDRGIKQMLKKAYAYAVFPSVGKASLVVGGSYGRGAVFEKGKFIGHATISQFTIGVQIGGDTFTELMVFENKEALDRLKKGKMAFAANASAVLVKAGAAGTKDFTNGVAAYAYSRGGMLLEAVIGGQKFKFKPADGQEQEDQEEGEEQEQKGGRAGASKGKGKGQAAAQDEDEGEEDQEDESGDEEGQEDGEEDGEEQESGLLGRAMGGIRSGASSAAEGVKSAASKVGETVKAHPVAATVVGTAVVAGVALLVMRSISGAGQDGSDEQEVGDENEPEASADEGEDEQEGDEEESEESGDTLNRLRRRRSSKA